MVSLSDLQSLQAITLHIKIAKNAFFLSHLHIIGTIDNLLLGCTIYGHTSVASYSDKMMTQNCKTNDP